MLRSTFEINSGREEERKREETLVRLPSDTRTAKNECHSHVYAEQIKATILKGETVGREIKLKKEF